MSNSKKFYWLKLRDNFFSDKVIKKLRKIAGGDTYTIIYLKLQLLSINQDGIIYFDGVEDTFEEELALTLDENVENVRVTLMYLQQNDLIEQLSEDEFLLKKVPELIGSESGSTERVRAHRNRTKALQCNTNVTQCNADVTKCNVEIEKEIDIDKDKENILKESSTSELPKQPTTKSKSTKFVKPTLEEVEGYCLERRNDVDPLKFWSYYESNGWKVGRNAMKSWKSAVITWERSSQVGGSKVNIGQVSLEDVKANDKQLREKLAEARKQRELEELRALVGGDK